MAVKNILTVQYKPAEIPDPPIARLLFGDIRVAWIWLIIRVYIGWQWFEAGLLKIQDPKWVTTGEAIQGFWQRAIVIPEKGRPPITYDWYRDFLKSLYDSGSHTWFGPLIAWGETLIGIGLILGALTGLAAIFGAFMNINFMLAGTASTNPVLFLLAGLVFLAWKTAGYWGLDRWLLPIVGTPWGMTKMEMPADREARPPELVAKPSEPGSK